MQTITHLMSNPRGSNCKEWQEADMQLRALKKLFVHIHLMSIAHSVCLANAI